MDNKDLFWSPGSGELKISNPNGDASAGVSGGYVLYINGGTSTFSSAAPAFTFNDCPHLTLDFPCGLCEHKKKADEAVSKEAFYPDPNDRLKVGELGVILHGKHGEFTTVKYLGVLDGYMQVQLRDGVIARFSPKDYLNIAIVKATTQDEVDGWGRPKSLICCQGEED